MTTTINDVNVTNGTATTPAAADNSTKIATTAFIKGLIQSSPGANGWVWIGDILVQWGKCAIFAKFGYPANAQAFPMPFPHACFVVIMGNIEINGQNSSLASVADPPPNPSGFNWVLSASGSINGYAAPYFIAIGN
jgi:hypothetical protein